MPLKLSKQMLDFSEYENQLTVLEVQKRIGNILDDILNDDSSSIKLSLLIELKDWLRHKGNSLRENRNELYWKED